VTLEGKGGVPGFSYWGSMSNHLSKVSGSHDNHCLERPLYWREHVEAHSRYDTPNVTVAQLAKVLG
jgi:hypothetical protein